MGCQEFNKLIPYFISNRMDYSRQDEFLKHYRECRRCREELEIHFLTDKVLNHDDQTSFNLMELLDEHIAVQIQKKKAFYFRKYCSSALFFMTEVVTLVAAVIYILFVLGWSFW